MKEIEKMNVYTTQGSLYKKTLTILVTILSFSHVQVAQAVRQGVVLSSPCQALLLATSFMVALEVHSAFHLHLQA